MQIKDGTVTLTGTDGKRLARSHIKIDADSGVSGEYIIPPKAVDEIAKNLTDGEEEATVFLMNDKIAVKGRSTT